MDLYNLSLFNDETEGEENLDPEGIKCVFPEVPVAREKKNLTVSQISGENSEKSPVVVLDSGEDSKEED
eukprot:5839999-Amphidinium_carterae.1